MAHIFILRKIICGFQRPEYRFPNFRNRGFLLTGLRCHGGRNTHHMYEDYLDYMKNNDTFYVEMDCVEGKKTNIWRSLHYTFPTRKCNLPFILKGIIQNML